MIDMPKKLILSEGMQTLQSPSISRYLVQKKLSGRA